ncbi:MAG TPA: nucleoside phosphorylase [Symbiobacteriaceae bacterium]
MPILNPDHAYREYVPPLSDVEAFGTHHVKARESDISRYCFIPGSHLRGRKIAEMLNRCHVVSATRGYYIYSGYAEGIFLTVCSTGMGGPVVAIAMEELHRLGADTFIRVGSAGAVQDDLGVGDIALTTGVVRLGGTSYSFLPASFPAVPDFDLTLDMKLAAAELGIPVHMGVTSASDAFYAPKDEAQRALFERSGVVAMEMEADTAFILSQYNGWRCAAGFVLDGGNAKEIHHSSAKDMAIANHADNQDFVQGEENLIGLSINAMVRCARRDAATK